MKQVSVFLVILAAVCWGSIGLFTKKLTALGFNEYEMLFVKVVLGVIVLLVVFLCKNKNYLYLKKPGDLKYFIGTGLISFAFFNLCYMAAIRVTSLGVAAVLLYTAPTMVMIFSILLFGEKLTVKKVITLITTFCGCVLVTGIVGSSTGGVTPLGLLFGLGAGLGYALYSVFGTFALKRGYHSMTITFYTFLIAAATCLFFVKPISLVVRITQAGIWPTMIGFSAITTLIPYLAYTAGLSRIDASKASMMATIEPVVAAALGIVVFHEDKNPLKLIGMALVLSAVILMSLEGKKEEGSAKNASD